MAFDPKRHVIRVQGNREYLPVAARLVWFRQEHPDWGIVTNPVEINLEKRYAIFSATIFNAEGKIMATATKMENVQGFADYLEKAETGSVGRALAYCGFGTQFAPELEEASGRFADAPSGCARAGSGPAPRRESTAPSALVPNACCIEGCPTVLTNGQLTASMRKFKRPLCLQHQKGVEPAHHADELDSTTGGTFSTASNRAHVHN